MLEAILRAARYLLPAALFMITKCHTFTITISQMRKLRHKEVQKFSQVSKVATPTIQVCLTPKPRNSTGRPHLCEPDAAQTETTNTRNREGRAANGIEEVWLQSACP